MNNIVLPGNSKYKKKCLKVPKQQMKCPNQFVLVFLILYYVMRNIIRLDETIGSASYNKAIHAKISITIYLFIYYAGGAAKII